MTHARESGFPRDQRGSQPTAVTMAVTAGEGDIVVTTRTYDVVALQVPIAYNGFGTTTATG
jgi:hypothetical protein